MTPFEKLKKKVEEKKCSKCRKPYQTLGIPKGKLKLVVIDGVETFIAEDYDYASQICTCEEEKHEN